MTCSEFTNEVEEEETAEIEKHENTDETGLEDGSCLNYCWGSCMSSCEQSKITTELRVDGECHVANTETRKCHIDACGRSDPCRVPFVVHSILFFAKTNLFLDATTSC